MNSLANGPLMGLSIAYIDEVKDERDNFFTDAYDSELFEQIHVLAPEENLQDLIDNLLNLGIDALITDFRLSEAGPLNYDGEEIVSAFLAVRNGFPCFIRTSHGPDALNAADDVNRVYSKDEAEEKSSGRSLFERVALQIAHHRKRCEDWQNELSELLLKDKSSLTASEVDRILELDTKIEVSLGKDLAISERVKRGLLDKETELLIATERLVAEIKRSLGD